MEHYFPALLFPGENMAHYALIEHSSAPSSCTASHNSYVYSCPCVHVNTCAFLYSTRRAMSKNQCKSRYTEATTNEETWDGISHCFEYAGTICACHVM